MIQIDWTQVLGLLTSVFRLCKEKQIYNYNLCYARVLFFFFIFYHSISFPSILSSVVRDSWSDFTAFSTYRTFRSQRTLHSILRLLFSRRFISDFPSLGTRVFYILHLPIRASNDVGPSSDLNGVGSGGDGSEGKIWGVQPSTSHVHVPCPTHERSEWDGLKWSVFPLRPLLRNEEVESEVGTVFKFYKLPFLC